MTISFLLLHVNVTLREYHCVSFCVGVMLFIVCVCVTVPYQDILYTIGKKQKNDFSFETMLTWETTN